MKWWWFIIEYQGIGAPRVYGCLCLKQDSGPITHAKELFNGQKSARKLKLLN